ncbi:hypothetical protein K505DRAFT_373910 [Melanomma pulvis-pyrius CBS 109.77]|uniref:Uncharacterized protein n=1 Tax=Melanomma pulvis-pyrius CBS 109.77 TaxID=1314802 RepID=A0A6A6XHP2_9PLEO|nr:hypothetical protein K505DRAFT_373910 [Melanomma pulvis-pyrius CBS 109.77]
MKVFAILSVLAASASAASFRACSGTNLGGSCNVKTNFGKTTGSWRSYNWRASTNMCVKICNGCTEKGWRCQDYSNNDIAFNKFIIFNWAGGEGPADTSCC